MSRKVFILVAFVLILVVVAQSNTALSAALAPTAPLPTPSNMRCQGSAADTVKLYWKDTAEDEDEYRVERKIGNGSWSEIATLPADSTSHEETGVDTSSQNRFYRVRSYRTSDTSYSSYSDVCNNRRITTTDNFRFFYGILGQDECPTIDGNQACLTDTASGGENIFITLQKTALEGSLDSFTRLGYMNDAGAPPSGLDKIPINVVWCDGGGCAGGGGLGLSPWLMEMPFDTDTRVGDPIAWVVALHEAYHFQQFKYPGLNDPASGWVYEGQARSIQDKICVGGNRSTAECFDDIDTGYAGYVGQVNAYLGNPATPINEASYSAALFWTYLTEKFGTSDPSDDVEAGMDLIIEFWEQANANAGSDGIQAIDLALADLGHSETFRDIWKDFAVASYAKDLSGPGVPAKYKYDDMTQTGGTYNQVALTLDEDLSFGEQLINTDQTVKQWAARYYEVRPDADVPIIDINFTQDSAFNIYYTVLGIKGTDIAYEHNLEARDLDLTLINDSYDRVVVIVAGLENLANFRYSFNGFQPELRILSPTTANKARVGDPAAPDKFMVQIEVVNPEGVPLAGVNLASFNFQIGAKVVPGDHILTSATVQGQHWFVLRAVTQDTATTYDLIADYNSVLQDTQSDAVNYIPRNDADSLLVIDHSGSMGWDDKLTSAQDAAHLFIDSWRTGDMIGVVAFNSTPSLELGLTDWTDSPSGGSREDAFDAIDALTASGGTNIGDSLRMGWDELADHGDGSHDWALVLLSDGKEEGSSPTETFDDLIDALVDTTDKKPVVHTVAVGPDADRPRMQTAATRTGGTYQFVSLPGSLVTTRGVTAINNLNLSIDSRYRTIATEIIGQQQIFSLVGPIDDGISVYDNVYIPVESGASELIISFSWDPSQGLIDRNSLVLYDPNGVAVSYFQTDNRHRVWRVPTPMGGSWRLYVQTYLIPRSEEENASPETDPEYLSPYYVQASLRSDVTMNVYLTTPVEERTPGVPMGIAASLTDNGPVTSAFVQAFVEQPSGAIVTLTLFDDGFHGDGVADDGIYANTYYQTGFEGSYNITISADGVSSLSGPFHREGLLSFHLDSQGDRDGDGLPDEWEDRYGTDPDVPDATLDPDADGKTTGDEQTIGTDPNDPDTDDDGESDGTDPDPLDPTVGGNLPRVWGSAYPGDSEVYIKYNNPENWAYSGLFRSETGPDGPFIYQMQHTPPNRAFTDTLVTNGTEYCYHLQVIFADGKRTPPSGPTCATPNIDPWKPHGLVIINNNEQTTLTPDVMLTLWATDEVDPHNSEVEEFLPPPNSASGVTEMMISNFSDMHDGVWESYSTTKAWILAESSGLNTVFVKYRDAEGNQSEVAHASINVGSGPGLNVIFLPLNQR